MADSLPIIELVKDEWIDVYAVSGIAGGTILEIQSLNAGDVRLHIGADQPVDADGYELIIKAGKTVTPPSPSGIWAFSLMGGAVYVRTYVGETTPVPIALFDGDNNPIGSLKGAIDVHDADVHDVPVNELFHRHTGISTTLAVPSLAEATSIIVVDDTGFVDGNAFQIEETVAGVTTTEVTFPTIKSGVGTNTFVLDRPLDNEFGTSATVEVVDINMAVDGTLLAPVAFRLIPDAEQVWHAITVTLSMTHSSGSDPSLFGDLTELANGLVFRAFNGATGQHRTFDVWKNNAQIGLTFGKVSYDPKVGSGDFGTFATASIKLRSGAVPKLSGANGDYLEGLVQDPLATMISLHIKTQGHIEGL